MFELCTPTVYSQWNSDSRTKRGILALFFESKEDIELTEQVTLNCF
jgi:hypothetical protein